jgi:hypothetical protein
MTPSWSLRSDRVRHRLAQVALAVGIALYCWFAAGIRPFTVPMEVAVALPEVLVARSALTPLARRRSSSPTPGEAAVNWRAAAPWVTLAVLLAFWEVAAFVASPRQEHPTLSSMAGWILGTHPGRAALMSAWLLLGWALFARPKQPESASRGS